MYKTVASFSPLARLMAKVSPGHDLRLLKSVVFSVCSVPVFPLCMRPTTSPPDSLPLWHAVLQLAHLLSPWSSHYLCCLQDSQHRKCPTCKLVGWVGSSCAAETTGTCLHSLIFARKISILLSCSQIKTFSTIFLTQFVSSTSHIWDTHMGDTLLPVCFIHFPVQCCWALAVEELRWEQNSEINKYDTW